MSRKQKGSHLSVSGKGGPERPARAFSWSGSPQTRGWRYRGQRGRGTGATVRQYRLPSGRSHGWWPGSSAAGWD